MTGILLWFGSEPLAYRVIAFVTVSAFVVAALRRQVGAPVFLALTALTVLAWRWPVFFYPVALNPDEAQALANALKITADPVPWRSFDPGTAGPLQSLVLAVPLLFGLRGDYVMERLVGIAMILGALFALYYAVSWAYGPRVARLALVPPALFFATTTDGDFVHYSSEHLPLLLIAVALAACSYLAQPAGRARRVLAAAIGGLALGCIPFAKLQAVPLALPLAAYLAAGIATQAGTLREIKRESLAAAAAACAPAVLILTPVILAGAWHDFAVSYVLSAVSYTAARNFGPAFFWPGSMAYRVFALGSLAVIAFGGIALAVRRVALSRAELLAAASAVLLCAAAVFAAWKPQHMFAHYLLLIVFPLCWLLANVLGLLEKARLPQWAQRAAAVAVTVPFAAGAVAALAAPNAFVAQLAMDALARPSPVAAAIARYVAPRGVIAVWGWRADLYVETGTLMASQDAVTARESYDGPYQNYYRDRYLSEVAAGRPRVVVDAVAPGSIFHDRAQRGLETFPALARLVRAHYALGAEVDGIRIFVAKPGWSAAGAPGGTAVAAASPDAASRCRDAAGANGVNENGTVEITERGSSTSIAGDVQLRSGARYDIAGWAIDPAAKAVLASMCLVVDGKAALDGNIAYGLPRADIATAFHDGALAASGYRVSIPARVLSRGRHRIEIVTITAAGAKTILRGPRTVTVI